MKSAKFDARLISAKTLANASNHPSNRGFMVSIEVNKETNDKREKPKVPVRRNGCGAEVRR
jgi:hypothetical protein